ncbi:hypothetical protein Droror1_Dr00019025 [Drosera rotundifolia]
MAKSVEGMESIVASVSGYHGTERFDLIKLISFAGANYVGTMSRSTTHLFCWKFEGKKYDLAKKFGTIIVNHRWLEDCIKARERIPEHSYTFLSGYEVGPITMELPAVFRTLAPTENDMPDLKSDGHTCLIDLECEDAEDGFHQQDRFIDENLFGQPRGSQNARCRTRYKKKLDEYLVKQDPKENSSSRILQPWRSASRKFGEESISDILKSPVNEKIVGSHDSKCTSKAEPSRRKRGLMKKNDERNPIDYDDSGSELVCSSLEKELRECDTRSTGYLYNINRHNEGITSRISERSSSDQRGIGNGDVMEVEVDRKGTNGHHNSCLNGEQSPSSGDETLPGIFSDIEKLKGKLEGENADCSARLSPVEVSCPICWTDYSSTRGVLLCGHRFCFSCIKGWADRSVSSGKQTKCPMCAVYFASIIKVEAAACLDQKVYSQTIPGDPSTRGVFIVPDTEPNRFAPRASLEPVCFQCQSREPEDLLMPCRFCQIQCVHSYCLDPPLFPWTCNGCRDHQIFHHRM